MIITAIVNTKPKSNNILYPGIPGGDGSEIVFTTVTSWNPILPKVSLA